MVFLLIDKIFFNIITMAYILSLEPCHYLERAVQEAHTQKILRSQTTALFYQTIASEKEE